MLSDCTACDLRRGCRGPVPGVGNCVPDNPLPDIFVLGEAPGAEEDRRGQPFVGKAGMVLDNLLLQAGSHRNLCYITNVVKCRPPGNTTPKQKHVDACSRHLQDELSGITTSTGILVAMGGTAMSALGISGGVELNHGRPIRGLAAWPGGIVLPTYHPAAGLHDTGILRHLQDDFGVLRLLLAGRTVESLIQHDEYPEPEYYQATAADAIRLLAEPEYALDTEATADGALWSVQVSTQPGTAWFISRQVAMEIGFLERGCPSTSHVIVHNWLYDAGQVAIPTFTDTMVMAYQIGLPQGLKELARRLCGMQMHSYDDVVAPYRAKKMRAYLEQAAQIGWGSADRTAKGKRPQPIQRKIKRILADCMDRPDAVDAWKRWHDIPEDERERVEVVMGEIQVDLSDVLWGDAVRYGCKDADATMRVYRRML